MAWLDGKRGGLSVFRRPLIPVAVSYASGAAVGFLCPSHGAATAFAVALALAVVAVALLRHSRWVFVLAAIFALAALRGALAHSRADAVGREFVALVNSDELVSVTGDVAAVFKGNAAFPGTWRHRFLLRNAAFRMGEEKRPLQDDVWVEFLSASPEKGGVAPTRGDRIEAVGHVHARRGFDEDAPSPRDVRLVTSAGMTRILPRRGVLPRLALFRRDAAETLSRGIGRMPRERDLILAMTLGLRAQVSQKTLTSFRRAGTIHVFAISGLHVGAMALMLVAVLSFMGVPRTYAILPLAPILVAYLYMTGLQPSAMRAALMVCIYYFALFAGRRPDSLGSVALALLAILAANPMAIAETSLVMSFTMVTGIILFTRPIAGLFRRAFSSKAVERDRRIAGAAGVGGDRRAAMRQALRSLLPVAWNKMVLAFAAALSAALVSFPLTACVFHTLVPYSFLANVVVVPLAFPVMAVAGTGLLLSALLPGVEIVTNNIAAWLAWVMCQVSGGVAALPYSSSRADFPVWALALWYGAMLLMRRRLCGLADGLEE